MSSNNSTSSSGSAGSSGGSSTHRPSNLSLAERIRLSRESEERDRRRQAQEDLHRLQEQSSHAAARSSSGEEYTMPLNDASATATVDEARGLLEPEESVAPPLEPEGVLAPANTTSRRSSSRSSSLVSEIDESDQDESQQQQQHGSVFSYAPSLVSGAMSAVTGTLSAMTGYTGGDEDNDSDSREDEMDQSQAVSRAAGAPGAEDDNDGNDRDDDGNSLTSYEKNVALHTAVQLGALTAEAGNDDMSEVASTYDVGSLSGYESAVPSVAGDRSTAGLSTGAMSRRTMGTKSVSIGGLETIGEEDSHALLAAEEGMSRQSPGRRSSLSGSSGAASSSHRGRALRTAAGAGGMAMAGPGLLDRQASSYSRSTMASGSSRGRWSTTDDDYTTAYTSASDYTTDYSYSDPSDSSRSFYSNPRFGFRNYNGASDRSFYTSSTSESGESTGEASRPSLLDAVSEKLSQSFRTIGTRSVSETSTSNWGSNSDLLTGSQKIPTKTGKRIRQADMMVRRRWAIPASIVLAVLLFLAIYLGLQSRKSGDVKSLDLEDGGGRGSIYGDDDAVLFQGDIEGGAFGLYPTASPAEIVSQVPTSEVMIHTVPSLLDDNYELGSEVGLSTTATTTEVATEWGVQGGQPTPDPALLPSLVQGADGTWGWQSGAPTVNLDSSFFENIHSETKTTTTTSTTTTTAGDGGSFTADTDVKLKWKVPAGSPTPNPALLSQVSTTTENDASLSVTGSDGTTSTTKETVSLLWKFPEGKSLFSR